MQDKLENLWVAEYSLAQDAFHVDTLASSIASNRRMVAEKSNNDYLIFGVYDKAEDADRACAAMRVRHGGGNRG